MGGVAAVKGVGAGAGWRSAAWLQPAVGAAVTACLLTALLWPVAAIVRRRHRVVLGLAGRDARARFLSRVASAALAVVTLCWVTIVAVGLSQLGFLGPKLDPVLFLMHLLS